MEEEVRKDIASLSDKEMQKLLRKESPELLVMLPDLQKKLRTLVEEIQPQVNSSQKDPATLPDGRPLSSLGKQIVDCQTQVQLNYCMMLLSYMLLKSDKQDVKEHPIMSLLVKSRYVLHYMLFASSYSYSISNHMFIHRAMADQMNDIQTKLLPALAKRDTSSSTTSEEGGEEEGLKKKKKKGAKGTKHSHREEGEEDYMGDEIDREEEEEEEEKGLLYDPALL